MKAGIRYSLGYTYSLTVKLNVMHVEVGQQLTYVNSPEEITQALIHSKAHGNVIGISAISLGPTMVMTAVEDIFDIKNDKLIVLKETDLLGIKLSEEQIMLSEIVQVHPFRTLFNDPFHVKLREM